MNSSSRITLVAASALLAATCAFGQQSASDSSGGNSSSTASSSQSGQSGQADQQTLQQLHQFAQDPNTAADKLFILEAAKGNMKEQMLAQQVSQKVQNPQVKQLAQRIMQDHQKAQQQLEQTAQKLGVQLPQQLPEIDQAMIQVIASLPADQLEKHYVAGMNADHARDILKYQCEATMGKDDSAKQYAKQTLPVLQQHDQQAMQTAQALGIQADMEAVTAGAHLGAGSSSGQSSQSQDNNSSGANSSGTSGSSGSSSSPGSNSGR